MMVWARCFHLQKKYMQCGLRIKLEISTNSCLSVGWSTFCFCILVNVLHLAPKCPRIGWRSSVIKTALVSSSSVSPIYFSVFANTYSHIYDCSCVQYLRGWTLPCQKFISEKLEVHLKIIRGNPGLILCLFLLVNFLSSHSNMLLTILFTLIYWSMRGTEFLLPHIQDDSPLKIKQKHLYFLPKSSSIRSWGAVWWDSILCAFPSWHVGPPRWTSGWGTTEPHRTDKTLPQAHRVEQSSATCRLCSLGQAT